MYVTVGVLAVAAGFVGGLCATELVLESLVEEQSQAKIA